MNFWERYKHVIRQNCTVPDAEANNINYWRNNLFINTVQYLLPLCLIALLPGVYFSVLAEKYLLGCIDILTATVMLLIAFFPGWSLVTRKTLFIATLYFLSSTLIYYLGLNGPGLIYLLTTCIFYLLIFSSAYQHWPAWINTFLCIFFGLANWVELVPWPKTVDQSLGAWIAVSSNLVFLSFMLTALLPRLFKGLQNTLNREKELTVTVSKQQVSLEQSLELLQQKNNELELFAYTASHDLKEPLRMIINFMELLKRKCSGMFDKKAHQYIDFAIDGGLRMRKMTDDLLELSRTGRKDTAKLLVDLNQLLQEVRQNLSGLIRETQADIRVKTQMPVLPVYKSDCVRLFQNLVTNAIKFRSPGTQPVIEITATEQEKEWLFIIKDNGIGIDSEHLSKIFDAFTRLHSQDEYQGTGIGLAICKKAVEQHGGRIWAESEKDGSAFYFTFNKD